MKNRLSCVSDEQLERCVAFARRHPQIVSVHHLLQKLTIFDFVVPVLRGRPHDEILEVGCGFGIHSALLSHYGRVRATELKVPGSFVGAGDRIDAPRDAVFRELGRGDIPFAYNDGRRLPYSDRSFDFIFHNSVIEHVPDVVAFNREIRRLLKPGGTCVCITGTPTLCWTRFLLGSVAKLPISLPLALARELVPGSGLARAARWLLSRVGVPEGLVRKIEGRLASVGARVRRALPEPPSPAPAAPNGLNLRPFYPRLQHFLEAPEYNRMVLEEVALETRLSPDELSTRLRAHLLGSVVNRVLFSLAPRTHGQHYRNWREELREWSVPRWIGRFSAAGLDVEAVRPYRFHHVLESTPLRKWDAYAYYSGAPYVRALVRRRSITPSMGSEILIVARRSGD